MIVTLRCAAYILSYATHHIWYKVVGTSDLIFTSEAINTTIAALALGYTPFTTPDANESGTELERLTTGQQARSDSHFEPVQV